MTLANRSFSAGICRFVTTDPVYTHIHTDPSFQMFPKPSFCCQLTLQTTCRVSGFRTQASHTCAGTTQLPAEAPEIRKRGKGHSIHTIEMTLSSARFYDTCRHKSPLRP